MKNFYKIIIILILLSIFFYLAYQTCLFVEYITTFNFKITRGLPLWTQSTAHTYIHMVRVDWTSDYVLVSDWTPTDRSYVLMELKIPASQWIEPQLHNKTLYFQVPQPWALDPKFGAKFTERILIDSYLREYKKDQFNYPLIYEEILRIPVEIRYYRAPNYFDPANRFVPKYY